MLPLLSPRLSVNIFWLHIAIELTASRTLRHVCALVKPMKPYVATFVARLTDALACCSGKGECPLYVDRDGKVIPAMCADYGFRSGAGRLYQESYGEVPKDVWQLVRAPNLRLCPLTLQLACGPQGAAVPREALGALRSQQLSAWKSRFRAHWRCRDARSPYRTAGKVCMRRPGTSTSRLTAPVPIFISCTCTRPLPRQARDNYRHELEQLRRSVRYPSTDLREPEHPVAKV
jgi:hypothetical protein